MFRDHVRLFEIAAIIKVSISRKFIYVYRWNRLLYVLQQQRRHFHQARCAQILFLSLMMWHATNRMRWENTSWWAAMRTLTASISVKHARIPKHLIRDNTNLLILFKQDCTNLKHVYNYVYDHVNSDIRWILFIVLWLLAKKIWISMIDI